MTRTPRSLPLRVGAAAVLAVAVAACTSSPPSSAPSTASPTPTTSEPAATATAAAAATPTASPAESQPARNPAVYVEGGSYAPVIDPADFVAAVDNPYFPLTPGTTYVFEGGAEHIEVEVTRETRTIVGVVTVVVHDRVWKDGQLIEDTFDWYAQDRWGNVWYFGEATQSIQGGGVVNTVGSWEAGVDGAEAGVVMLAQPVVGDTYRQEFYAGRAEDVGKVVALNGHAEVQGGSYEQVLITEDWTPLEPNVVEEKTYAPGVGFIFERFVTGGTGTLELIEIRGPG